MDWRRIFAGSDFFLMPSRFEPCGLAQLYAMRYGSLPIARKTGGLADTIDHFSRSTVSANGFLFEKANSKSLKMVIHRAIKLFAKAGPFSKIRKNALESPCSWDGSQALRRSLRLDPELSRIIQAGLGFTCITFHSFL